MGSHAGGFLLPLKSLVYKSMCRTLSFPGLFKQTQSIVKVALVDRVPKQHHSMVFGWYNSISTLGFVVGPVLGGHIADMIYGRRLVFITAGAVFILNAGGLNNN